MTNIEKAQADIASAQKTLEQAQKTLEILKAQEIINTPKLGERYQWTRRVGSKEVYLVACCDYGKYYLVNIANGNRWRHPEGELKDLFGEKRSEFDKVTVRYTFSA